MPKIERKTQKIFGGNAESDQLAVFGSMITGTPVYNDDIETLQSEAYTEGWSTAIAANEAPFLEEMNGVQYGFSKQLAYLFQQGIPEWDSGTTYYLNSFCQVGGVIYKSMQDENINHSPAEDTAGTYWTPFETGGGSGGGLEVGTIGFTQGAVDETKNLVRILNGQLVTQSSITNGIFSWFNTSVAQNPAMATTEGNWQSENTANGMCGKFVYTAESTTNYYAYSSGSTTYFTTSTEDSESVNVYNTEFELQGTGSISSGVLTYNTQTYNRASGSDDSVTNQATLRLPNYPKYFIGNAPTGTLQVVGNDLAIGLVQQYGDSGNSYLGLTGGPAGSGSTYLSGYENVYGKPIGTDGSGAHLWGGYHSVGLTPDGSKSGLVTTEIPDAYKITGTYFIQIATGQETEVNITNEIELNNPYTLFDSKYTEAPLYNSSWLISNETYYSKTVYVTAYEALAVEQNSAIEAGTSVQLPSGSTYIKRGLSIKLSTASDITDYDFVINTTDETFRLPVKTTKANQEISGLYLYFYVGETVQNANLIDVGRFAETKANKTDVDGQWVELDPHLTLLENGSLNQYSSKSLDVSDILPDDNYDYYVAVTCIHRSILAAVLDVSGSIGPWISVRSQVANQMCQTAGIILVGTDRTITYQNAYGAVSEINIGMSSYCRKGKNI